MTIFSETSQSAFVRLSGSANLLDSTPLRSPNLKSERVMGRRAWWLITANFFIPGSAQVLAGNRRLGRFGLGSTLFLWLAVLLLGGIFIVARSAFISIFTQGWVLLLLQIGLVFYFILWIVLTLDTLRLVRIVKLKTALRYAVPIVSITALVLSACTMIWAANSVGAMRNVIQEVFTNTGPPVEPSRDVFDGAALLKPSVSELVDEMALTLEEQSDARLQTQFRIRSLDRDRTFSWESSAERIWHLHADL